MLFGLFYGVPQHLIDGLNLSSSEPYAYAYAYAYAYVWFEMF